MDSRMLCIVLIFAGFGMFVNVVVTNPTVLYEDIPYDIAKLFQDCNISNPVTFAECQRRVKREANLHEDLMYSEKCWGPCMSKCITEKTLPICRETCLKECTEIMPRNKRNFTIHVVNDDKTYKPPILNVTNHIHVHYDGCSPKTSDSHNKMYDNPQNCPCYFVTWFPCYCRPQHPVYQYPYLLPVSAPGIYTGNNCACPNGDTHCSECNPA